MSNSKSESEIQEFDGEMEFPEEFLIAHRDIQLKIEYLFGYHQIKVPPEYMARTSFLLKQFPTEKSLHEYVTTQQNRLERDHEGVNGQNLLSRRDAWFRLSIDAICAAKIFAKNDSIDKAWFCLNISAYQIARVQIITQIEIRIRENISMDEKIKSKEALSRETINKKKLLIDLFFKNAPESGWKNLKLALYEIRPHLIKEMQAKKPKDNQQEVERASEELLQKLGKWMRTDLNFKSQIYRHIHNKIVPDLSKLD